jgi:hypothetical protein
MSAIEQEGKEEARLLKQTTSGWSGKKPDIDYTIYRKGNDIILHIGPQGRGKGADKWRWIDEGTKPHVITPKVARRLRFKTGYTPGSRRGTLKTTRGRASGKTVYAKKVNHPGISAREWSKTLLKQRRKTFVRNLNRAVKRGIR